MKKLVLSRVKAAQDKFQTLLKGQDWVEEARKYAERQGAEMRKHFTSDLGKMRKFLEKQRHELERFQRQIPGDVKKFRDYVRMQSKDLEKLLSSVAQAAGKRSKKKTTKKRASTKKSAS